MHLDLYNVRTLVTHDDCPDGLASAILLQNALPGSELLFLKHGTPDYENLQAKPGMLFADICPPFERVQEFIDAGAIVLDHHKTAKDYVARFGENGRFADEKTDPGVSGAMLCYRHVWDPVYGNIPEAHFAHTFARLAGIRDTWQRSAPEWREACKQSNVLMFMPRDRWLSMSVSRIAKMWTETFDWVGETLYEQQAKRTARAVKGARYVKTEKGTRLVIFEGTTKTSDAAELIHEGADLIIGFNYFEEDFPEGRRTLLIMSTRSHTTYDCAKLAEYYGGGGHTKAAGFRAFVKTNDTNPYDYIAAMVTEYELLQG